MKFRQAALLAVIFMGFGFLNSVEGAIITWGTPTTISGDSDVITDGILVSAIDISTNAINPTVNGVTFVSGTGAAGFSSGTVQNTFGSASAPFSGLSSSYKDLLMSGIFSYDGNNPAPMFTLTLTGLTINNTYKFQVWRNESVIDGANRQGDVVAGNSVTLDQNSTEAAGGVGQFVVGTFVADATTQAIAFSGGNVINLANAYQLRDVTVVVPEPTGALLALLGLIGLVASRRRIN
jgi:MYXO-CTERM domain-containing protein